MPRTARKLLGNIYIHNMVQGINREYIFESNYQKKKYFNLMKKYSEKYKILIVAYCIMDNHAHILTYSNNINNISLFMKEANTEYATYYNKSNDRVGYVFRNRFNSKPILNRNQLLHCIKYIHMNPVKAGITNKEDNYQFSSYNDYIKKENFINSQILNLLFQSENNYIEKFKKIEYKPMHFEKQKIELANILKEFISQNNINPSGISRDSIIIKKFIEYLTENEYKFTKKELAEVLNISRANLYRKLEEKENTENDNF